MKIDIISDCHLEFGDLKLPGGDVLIMAGDMMVTDVFRTNRTDGIANKHRKIFNRFINKELPKYQHVLYVLGNHEHYSGCFQDTLELLRKALASQPHVRLLDNETCTIDDVVFFGGTFWTDMSKRNPLSMLRIGQGITDFQIIRYRDSDGLRTFRPEDAADEFDKSVAALSKAYLDHDQSKKFVVISHHAPTAMSSSQQYANSDLNSGFYSNLDEFIMDHPNIRLWIHGHMHSPSDYIVGDTRVVAHPRGYIGQEPAANRYNPKFTIEL